MRQHLLAVAGLFTFAYMHNPAPVSANGNLLVTPTRVVFEGRNRSADISLVNSGSETVTYRISLIRQRMTKEGAVETITTATSKTGERFADKLIRFTPRQVVLPPGVEQTVRIQVRKPANLPAGEYRSHLLFRGLPPVEKNAPAKKDNKLEIKLIPVFGVSIPIIVRHGNTSAKTTLSKLRVLPKAPGIEGPALELLATRKGNKSVYGDFVVTAKTIDGEQIVGQLKGVAVYTPNAERIIRIPLQPPAGLVLSKIRLNVAYQDRENPSTHMADATVDLP